MRVAGRRAREDAGLRWWIDFGVLSRGVLFREVVMRLMSWIAGVSLAAPLALATGLLATVSLFSYRASRATPAWAAT